MRDDEGDREVSGGEVRRSGVGTENRTEVGLLCVDLGHSLSFFSMLEKE